MVERGKTDPYLRYRFALAAAGSLIEERAWSLSLVDQEAVAALSKPALRGYFKGILEIGKLV